MPKRPDETKRSKILEVLTAAEGHVVRDEDMLAVVGCSEETIKIYVHYLREAGHEIRRVRGAGYFLCGRRDDAYDPNEDLMIDGRDWRPEQIHASEDPLLDALQAEHPERLGGKFSHYSDVRPAA